jgi:N-succinyldiaminopimelate aminotransferase
MLPFRGRGPVAVFVSMTKSDVSAIPASGPPDARSPFARLNDLLADVKPGKPPIALSVGEPQHPIPDFVGPVLAAHLADFGRYPANRGIDPFLAAAAAWLGRRFKLNRPVDPNSEVLVLNGTREGLFLGAITARQWVGKRSGRPAILIPNPFYAAYAAGAMAADCEAVYLPTTKATGFLPDLDALSDELLSRTVVFYLASPSNPQGAVADAQYLTRLCALARRFGFLIFADECYCDIYGRNPPAGMLEVAGSDFANVVVFHSLSKRSNMPGLRVGFCAGDRRFLARFIELRNVAAPQVPVPAQHVAIAAYNDEAHVQENRRLYAEKFDLTDQIIGDRYGYKRPAGGFFLWLDVSAHGGDEPVTVKLWRDQADGSNPGQGYIRVALVHDNATTAEAMHRLVAVLG